MNKFFIISLIIITFSTLIACNQKVQEDSDHNNLADNQIIFTKEKIKLAEIEIGKLNNQFISKTISCKGRILAKPQNYAKIASVMSGYVKKILVNSGQSVNKGKSLIELQNPEFIEMQKNYLKTKAQHYYIEKEYNRQKELNDKKAGVGKEFEKATATYNEIKAELAAFRINLQMLNINPDNLSADKIYRSFYISAPIHGVINNINVSLGQYIHTEDVLMEIINNKDFFIELEVFERDIHKISIDQLVTYACTIPESQMKEHDAKIISIGNIVDKENKTFKVQAVPQKCDIGMRHGIFLDARIHLNNHKAWTLPEEAVFKEDDDYFIFTVQSDSVFNKQYVKTGIQENGYYEILNKDLLNSKIVIKGGNYIKAEIEN